MFEASNYPIKRLLKVTEDVLVPIYKTVGYHVWKLCCGERKFTNKYFANLFVRKYPETTLIFSKNVVRACRNTNWNKYCSEVILTFRATSCGSQGNVAIAADGAILPVRPITTVNFETRCRIDHRFVVTARSHFHTCGYTHFIQEFNLRKHNKMIATLIHGVKRRYFHWRKETVSILENKC